MTKILRYAPAIFDVLRSGPRAVRQALLPLPLILLGTGVQSDTLEHLSTFDIPTEDYIGLSGLEVSDDGRRFYAVGDRGWYFSGMIEREGDRIVGVTFDRYLPILGNTGLPVSGRRSGDWSDAEGLAVAPDGTYWISFERWARVSQYDAPDQAGNWIKDHPTFQDYADNRQLEALALHPDGTLYTFAEHPLDDGFAIYRLDDAVWSISGYIEKTNRFAIVGADFDADGQLYLLERKLVLGLWWQSRVRRLNVEAPEQIETLWTSERGEFFNVEGIALWRDGTGLRITMVSDNNADTDEPTQFIDFRLVREN